MNGMPWPVDSLPNLHPALVHFPAAILPLAAVADAAYFFAAVLRGRAARGLDGAVAGLYGIGAAGALAAWLSGRSAADGLVDVAPSAFMAVSSHSDAALRTLMVFAALALARMFLFWRDAGCDGPTLAPARGVVALAGLAGLLLLAETADRGGALVYRHGLGVRAAAGARPTAAPAGAEPAGASRVSPAPAGERLVRSDDGSVRWTPAPGDFAALGEVLRPAAAGSLDALSAVDGGEDGRPGPAGLEIFVDGAATALLPGRFDDVMIEAVVDLSDFEGSFGLDHHVLADGRRGRFTVSTDGRAALVDTSDGATLATGDGAWPPASPGASRVAVSVAGRHLKGLVDGKMVAHGHRPYPKPGACGLFLDGTGRVRIESVTVTPLAE